MRDGKQALPPGWQKRILAAALAALAGNLLVKVIPVSYTHLGIAGNPEQCAEILENGLRLSRVGQVLVERCIAGWKEIEYEVMRDGAGNVCLLYTS